MPGQRIPPLASYPRLTLYSSQQYISHVSHFHSNDRRQKQTEMVSIKYYCLKYYVGGVLTCRSRAQGRFHSVTPTVLSDFAPRILCHAPPSSELRHFSRAKRKKLHRSTSCSKYCIKEASIEPSLVRRRSISSPSSLSNPA